MGSPVFDGRTQASLRAFSNLGYALHFDVTLRRRLTASEQQTLALRHHIVIEGDGLEIGVRSAPMALGALVELDAVERVSCGRFESDLPVVDDWQQRLNFEALEAWNDDLCWIYGQHVELDGPLDQARREDLSRLQAESSGRPDDTAISVVLPRDALPALVSLPFVLRFEIEPKAYPN